MIQNDPLTEKIIGAAIEVHRVLGPGVLGSAYEECLCHELRLQGITFTRQQPLPVVYKGVHLDCGYRIDKHRATCGEKYGEPAVTACRSAT
jgi:GxxExxY protein